jgi:hypothetical protein
MKLKRFIRKERIFLLNMKILKKNHVFKKRRLQEWYSVNEFIK